MNPASYVLTTGRRSGKLARMPPKKRLEDADYERLLEFRTGLRRFLKWSKDEAAKAGLAPSQHQLLLAIRGHRTPSLGPTVSEIADYLLIRAHTAGELAARAAAAGLVERVVDSSDARVVRLRLTKLGERKIESITEATLEELDRLGPRLRSVWRGLGPDGR